MTIRQQRIPVIEQLKNDVAKIGGELLAGSGFENETPDPEFSESVPAALEPQ